MTEETLLRWLMKRYRKAPGAFVAAGDDAAVLPWGRRDFLLLTVDTLVDGIHFIRSRTPAGLIGRKALAVNLSDIAAMAGLALYALVALGMPAGDIRFVKALYRGMEQIARRYRVRIIGGNISRSPVLFVDVCLVGRVERKRLKLRGGGSPGDIICVTGSLGGSLAGKHLTFTPRIREARRLAASLPVSSMMDISDGLSADLSRLAAAAHTGFRLDLEKIPVAPEAMHPGRSRDDALAHALNDGEDYELLFTVPAEAAGRIPRRVCGTAVTPVGVLTRRRTRVGMLDGRVIPVVAGGYDHFR